ncbi:MAG TPA: hypothetical protein ENN80_09130 [Candidatus Hydrogenedentes bacterium]|nr:hypothetical protein [Candidatus Hydrogenedentota bacterium]
MAYGRGAVAAPREVETPADVLAEMDHCGIAEALVWHRDAFERGFAAGNRRTAELASEARLHAVWTVVPPCCQEMPSTEGVLAAMREAGARAVRCFPAQHCFLMNAVSCGDLFEAFIAHAVPLFVPLPQFPGQWQDVYALMRDFPRLTVVLTQTGCWGQDRYFRPLMKTYPGFHITMDRLETAGQLKSLVDRVGPEQVLFGSGLPRNYPGAYVLSLTRADIAEDAREAIARGNIERLLGGVLW